MSSKLVGTITALDPTAGMTQLTLEKPQTPGDWGTQNLRSSSSRPGYRKRQPMETTTLRRVGWICGALGLTGALVGCNDTQSSVSTGVVGSSTTGVSTTESDLDSTNGLNGLNGLNAVNGLNSANGLNSVNGLAAGAGLMTTDAGRKTVSYLVRCALATGDSLVKQDQNGAYYTFTGAIGLAPQYKTTGCNKDCAEELSAC